MEALLGIDIGTSSVKSLLLSLQGQVLAVHSSPYPTFTPRPGWVEQDPDDWWKAAVQSVTACLDKCKQPITVSAISLSGHMSALVLVTQEGRPVLPSITLADNRSMLQTTRLRRDYGSQLAALSGNLPISAFQLPKLLWVQDNYPELLANAHCVLFPKDYVRFHLTRRFATDTTDAGNSMVFNVSSESWETRLIQELQLPVSLFPDCIRPSHIAGVLHADAAITLGLQPGTPVACGAADMACSAIGTGSVRPGVVSVTIGTAAQVVVSVPSIHPAGIGSVTFHPHVMPGTLYAMGSIFTGGLAMQWLSSLLDPASHGEWPGGENSFFSEFAGGRDLPQGGANLWFLPFLAGRGSPEFHPDFLGAFVGLRVNSSRTDIARAVMEGVAFHIKESFEVFEQMGVQAERVHIAGGGAKIEVWRRIVTDVLGMETHVLETSDASALGAAVLAGIGVGAFPDVPTAVQQLVRAVETERPDPKFCGIYQSKYKFYKELVDVLRPFYEKVAITEGGMMG